MRGSRQSSSFRQPYSGHADDRIAYLWRERLLFEERHIPLTNRRKDARSAIATAGIEWFPSSPPQCLATGSGSGTRRPPFRFRSQCERSASTFRARYRATESLAPWPSAARPSRQTPSVSAGLFLAWVDRAHVRLSREVLLGWIPQRWMRALALSIASHLAAQHRCQHIRRSKSSRLDFPLPLSPVSTRCKNAGELHFKNMINSILRRQFFTLCQRL